MVEWIDPLAWRNFMFQQTNKYLSRIQLVTQTCKKYFVDRISTWERLKFMVHAQNALLRYVNFLDKNINIMYNVCTVQYLWDKLNFTFTGK